MKAKQRTLILLLVCALLASAALALLNRSNEKAEEAASAAEEGTIPLSAFAAEDLSKITYTYNGETLTLNYADGAWTLDGDEAYHLDTTACNTMRTALCALNAKRQLTAESGEDYGFASPLVTVTVTAAGETNTFTFGAENSVTGDIYVQKDGDEAVYTVAANKASCFEMSKTDLFGAFSPAGLTSSDIQEVRCTLASGETVAIKAVSEPVETDEADSEDSADSEAASETETEYETVWRLESDAQADLDETKVNGILSALASYVSGQITNADAAQYGLDTPLVTVEAVMADGTARLSYYSGTDGYYLIVDGDSSLYKVDETTVQALCCTEGELKGEE